MVVVELAAGLGARGRNLQLLIESGMLSKSPPSLYPFIQFFNEKDLGFEILVNQKYRFLVGMGYFDLR